MSTKFRFHLLGFPHTQTNRSWGACAYTQKVLKFVSMMAPRGHEIIHYGNEGSVVPNDPREPIGKLCEHVEMLTEKERSSWFGKHDRQRLYDLQWSAQEPYWQLFNERAIAALKLRVKKGDFILTPAGANCHQPIGDHFPGSYSGTPYHAMMVESGIGYYGTFSRYRVFETNTHREWMMGKVDNRGEDNDTAAIYNYFDLEDFRIDEETEKRVIQKIGSDPYFLFIGRVIQCKGVLLADQIANILGARIVIAGQGDLHLPGGEDPNVIRFGHATIEERAVLMSRAIAVLAPTHFREPFGGVAVEAQLCGTPAITTDQGAFCETVDKRWRCASLREFLEAAIAAQKLTSKDRLRIQAAAQARFSLEAIAPIYERYFNRLFCRWGAGWDELRDIHEVRADHADMPQMR